MGQPLNVDSSLGLLSFAILVVLNTAAWVFFLQFGSLLVPILFYPGLGASAFAALATCVVVRVWPARFGTGSVTLSFGAIALESAQVCLFALTPVSFDRSVSIFLLSTISESSKSTTAEEARASLVESFVAREDAVGRRLREQISSGNIVENTPGHYRITKQGQ